MCIDYRATLLICFSTLFLSATQARGCTVEEVVDMVSDGSGYKVIRDNCDRDVDGAPRCVLQKVVQYAQADMDESEIETRCGLCDTPSCQTNYGACAIVGGYGQLQDQGRCTCQAPMGFVPGIINCNN